MTHNAPVQNPKTSVYLRSFLPKMPCALLLFMPLLIGNAAPVDHVLIDKSDRTMWLLRAGKIVRTYSNIKLGDAPVGHKQFEGDERTPEGRYTINGRNAGSRYHLSLRVSYPNAADRSFAAQRGKSPGGDIFIHGQPNGSLAEALPYDWTDGCVAVSNRQIKEVWRLVGNGTKVTIRP
jgi:murein L,D-transpeptidase YafK